MDPSLPLIYYGNFKTKQEYFAEYYKDTEEPMIHWMPWPQIQPVALTGYVDYYHVDNNKN